MANELFEGLPVERAAATGRSGGRPRLRSPVRDQIEWRMADLDSLLGEDHPARLIWAYVERLDLGVLEDRVKAREGVPGHPPISPRLMLALWLYATSRGVGSARALARLCAGDDAFRWLCGGVSVNHHTLGDFRVAHPDLLDRLLVENVAALAKAGVIDLDTLAQDGMRVRASAGAASFRRRQTLERCREEARALVERLRREVDDDPAAGARRLHAAKARAARERAARVEAALAALGEAEARRERRAKTNKTKTERQKEPRASTTDPEARVMKMADGGFRPAYNPQIVSALEAQVVVAVEVDTTGADRGLIRPLLDAVKARYGRRPARHLADGGYTKNEDIEWAHGEGTALSCPPIKTKHATDPFRSRPGDGPGVAAWRLRMGSPEGKDRYRRRSIAEGVHARFRHWRLTQFTVRGRDKARAVLLWFALTNNILRGHALAARPA